MVSRSAKRNFLAGLLGLLVPALAQYGDTGTSSPSPAYSSPAPAAASAAGGEREAPRTGLYADILSDNPASDNTVEDFTERPHLIQGLQYIAGYGDREMQSGAFSFSGAGYDWFGSAELGNEEHELRFGLATPGLWGVGLILALNREYEEVGGVETTTKDEGHGFGLFGSLGLGAGHLFGQFAYYTGYEPLFDNADPTVEREAGADETHTVILFEAGWRREAENQGEHALEAEFHMGLSKGDLPAPNPTEKFNRFGLEFNHGYILVGGPEFAVFLGTQNFFQLFTSDPGNRSGYGFSTRPNIGFQKELGWNFEAQGGLGVEALYSTGKSDGNNGSSLLRTTNGDYRLGLRWAYENLAVEGYLEDEFLADGPYFVGGKDNGLFGRVGVSVGF